MAAFKRTLAFPVRPHFSPAAPPLQTAPGSDPRSTKGVLQHTSRWLRRTQLGHRSHRHSYPTGYYVTEITSSSWYFSIFFSIPSHTRAAVPGNAHKALMHVLAHSHKHSYILANTITNSLGFVCVCVSGGLLPLPPHFEPKLCLLNMVLSTEV